MYTSRRKLSFFFFFPYPNPIYFYHSIPYMQTMCSAAPRVPCSRTAIVSYGVLRTSVSDKSNNAPFFGVCSSILYRYPKCGTTWMQQICHGLRSGTGNSFAHLATACVHRHPRSLLFVRHCLLPVIATFPILTWNLFHVISNIPFFYQAAAWISEKCAKWFLGISLLWIASRTWKTSKYAIHGYVNVKCVRGRNGESSVWEIAWARKLSLQVTLKRVPTGNVAVSTFFWPLHSVMMVAKY